MPKKYSLITYGCQMNEADSQRIAQALEKKGQQPASKIDEADLVVVNMCSVRQSAVDRVFGMSRKLAEIKKQNPKIKTILTGCILQKDKKQFANRFDEVKPMRPTVPCPSPLIPISNGCNNLCTYCVVPFVRGKLVCRDHRVILREVKTAVKNGFKEIWLLGQNVNDYQSPADRKVNFAKLLKMANDLPGEFSMRFTAPHPKNLTDELIGALADYPKVAKYLQLPIQSGDNRILKKMRRNYTVKQYRDLVEKIRKRIPGINLSTDVIVGFPGETKKQFQNTAELFREIRFDMAYVAKYSPRPGTYAFQMKDDVPWNEKKRREKILRGLIKKHE